MQYLKYIQYKIVTCSVTHVTDAPLSEKFLLNSKNCQRVKLSEENILTIKNYHPELSEEHIKTIKIIIHRRCSGFSCGFDCGGIFSFAIF